MVDLVRAHAEIAFDPGTQAVLVLQVKLVNAVERLLEREAEEAERVANVHDFLLKNDNENAQTQL